MKFEHYQTGPFFDEMFEDGCEPRAGAQALFQLIETMVDGELLRRQQSAERVLLHMGITFNVYGDSAGTERIFPFDLVPRIVAAAEWNWIERGLKQRIRALNLFIDDVYHDQSILKDGVIPDEIIRSASSFRKQCVGMNPPGGVWCGTSFSPRPVLRSSGSRWCRSRWRSRRGPSNAVSVSSIC